MATQIAPTELPVIRAAGGILLRDSPGGDEVMIVFRTKYQDWTLPKGKLKDNESFESAALREVEEETGCRCRLDGYLGMISYAHEGIPKVVMFWKMVVLEERPRAVDDEISEALWLPVPAALQVLTYAQEKSLLNRVSPPLSPEVVSPAPEPEVDAAKLIPEPQSSYDLEPDIHPLTAAQTAVPASVPETAAHIPSPETIVAVSARESAVAGPPELLPVVEPEPALKQEDRPGFAELTDDHLIALPEHLEPHDLESPTASDTAHIGAPQTSASIAATGESPRKLVTDAIPRILPRPILPPRHKLLWPKRGRRALQHELDAFRVEINFLDERGVGTDGAWWLAVQQHYANVSRCLVEHDVKGGWKALRGARRYATLALTAAELSARAQVLRDEAVKISSWRRGAIQRLLAVNDDKLTHARIADAMLLRDDEASEQQQRANKTRLRLQLLLLICIAGAISLLLSFSSPEVFQEYAPLAFAGLLGSALSAAQQVVQARERGKIPGIPILLALSLSSAAAGLIADPIYKFGSHYFKLKHTNDLALYALAFILGYSVERTLSHFAGYPRENVSVH